ncbi:MAG TPA: hypothetical protein VEH84_07280 [Alphaproteobacteria bacterium]|nr:hypothetical protein [Alphaproteobacteria bacterium]
MPVPPAIPAALLLLAQAPAEFQAVESLRRFTAMRTAAELCLAVPPAAAEQAAAHEKGLVRLAGMEIAARGEAPAALAERLAGLEAGVREQVRAKGCADPTIRFLTDRFGQAYGLGGKS